MATKLQDFYRGDTRTYAFDFGVGVNITNWKITFTLKENADDPDNLAVLQVSSVAGDNVLDDVLNGKMYITVSSVDTAKLEVGVTYFYGFQRVIVGSNPPDVKTLHTGKVKILQDITITT